MSDHSCISDRRQSGNAQPYHFLQTLSFLTIAFTLVTTLAASAQKGIPGQWQDDFPVDRKELKSFGQNTYFILEPGYQLRLAGGREALVITVLDETKLVDGVETRVVEERESRDGKPIEISRNYFAIDPRTGNVYYFGEEVDIYRGDSVVRHEGAWLAGAGDARFGLMMPGRIEKRMRYYQEIAPGVAMDRAEVVSVTASIRTPAGAFTRCLKTVETTPLEPGEKEYKYYAPGIGIVCDGQMKLVHHRWIDSRR